MKPRYVVMYKGRYLTNMAQTTADPYDAQVFRSHESASKWAKRIFKDSFEAIVVPHGEALFAAEGKHNEQIAEQGQQDEDAMRQTDEGYAELRGMA